MKKMKKQPTVVERKLGRQQASGQAWKEDNLIEIDPRQSSKEYFLTLIHERLHIMFPEWNEKKIAKAERELGNFLWKHKCRIIK